MGDFKQPGRKLCRPRFEMRVDQKWIDLVAKAAQELGYKGTADYVRKAVAEKLMADGYVLPKTCA